MLGRPAAGLELQNEAMRIYHLMEFHKIRHPFIFKEQMPEVQRFLQTLPGSDQPFQINGNENLGTDDKISDHK